MCPVRQPADVQQPKIADESAIKTWLDALAIGACDAAAFLQYMQKRFASDADGNWEVLSQLDQYYRRGRITTEVFHTVKKALAESALGGRSIPVAREPAVAREIPMVPEIPVAVEIAVPQATMRTELSDTHRHREETPQSPDATDDLRPGSVLRRRYRIENVLGQSEMGTVFQALDEYRLDTPPGQKLAIKVLHTAVTKRAELLTQLRREFQLLQLLSHPNIVRVFEFDRDGPVIFFTMELLNGPLLSRVLQARRLIPLERAQAWAVVRDIGAAIAHAHSRGVVHGSINPQNIFITVPGELRVLDFAAAHRSNSRSSTPDHEMTMPFAASAYASCQVLEGERADVRDDVFALACIAYLLLSGEHPFSKKTAIEARQAKLNLRRPPNLTNRQWQALRAGLRWEREHRPADVQEWLERLDLRGAAKRLAPISDLLEPPPRKKSKSFFGFAVAAGVVLLLGAAFWIISNRGALPQIDSSPPISADASSPPTAPVAAPVAPPAAAPPAATSSAPTPTPRPPPASNVTPAVTPPMPTKPAAAPSVPPSAGVSSGPSKVELTSDTVDVPAPESLALLTVHRKGSLRGETSFTWWTESGTAKPKIDFSPVVPQLAYIGDGKSSVSLSIPLSKAPRTQSKSFYVVIDQAEGGAALGGRTLTMVTLLPSD